jgi:hypothetical protein
MLKDTNRCMWKLFHKWGRGIKENDGGGEFNYDILQEIL